eukprot:scaffold103333_cov19-Prasinocladus_malaysianus.AAC.1
MREFGHGTSPLTPPPSSTGPPRVASVPGLSPYPGKSAGGPSRPPASEPPRAAETRRPCGPRQSPPEAFRSTGGCPQHLLNL